MNINIKKLIAGLSVFMLFFTANNALAAEVTIKMVDENGNVKIVNAAKLRKVSREQAFNFVMYYAPEIPDSYKYIMLNFKGLDKDSFIYQNLQKAVYLDAIRNSKVNLGLDKNITVYEFFTLIKKVVGEDFIIKNDPNKLKKLILNEYDLRRVRNYLDVRKVGEKKVEEVKKPELKDYEKMQNYKIFKDVYETLERNFLWNKDLDEDKMFSEATKALVEASPDEHTAFLLPKGRDELFDGLNNSMDGVIGAYVKRKDNGEIILQEILPNSGAKKAGLLDGDIVTKIGDKFTNELNSLKEVTALLRGETGTKVMLEISRGARILNIEVTRSRIQLDNVIGTKYEDDSYIVNIRAFGTNTFSGFKEQLKQIKKDSTIENLIFDLRGNPGGIIGEAENMLDYVFPKGDLMYTVNMQNDKQEKVLSSGVPEEDQKDYGIDFSKYNIYVLVNDGTASAAELFTTGLKQAFPNTKVVGITSYGKASMQTLRGYRNGSTLKYTIAVWTVGKDEVKVHKVGIIPDIEIKLDKDLYTESKIDSQMQAVLNDIENNN